MAVYKLGLPPLRSVGVETPLHAVTLWPQPILEAYFFIITVFDIFRGVKKGGGGVSILFYFVYSLLA